MSHEADLSIDVIAAMSSLPLEEMKLINPRRAQEVIETVLDKRRRVRDKGLAMCYSFTERHIGAQGLQADRRKIFAAYWHLTWKVLRMRDGRNKRRRVF